MDTGTFDVRFSGEPLIGRSDIIRSIVKSLGGDDMSIWVVGEPGLGKSAVARTVEYRLGNDVRLVRLIASRPLVSVPFGALAPLLNGLSFDDISSPVVVIRRVIQALRKLPGTDAAIPIIVVDDAHFLDESSAAILAQVVAAGVARLFALSRDVPDLPENIVGLWREGLVRRIDLEALTRAEVHELCTRVLDDSRILQSISAAFDKVAHGNPMFVLALIEQAKRQNHLVNRHGEWLLRGEPPGADQALSDVVETELVNLSSEQRMVLEMVALAEPLPLGVLRELACTADIDVLEGQRVITIGPAPERLVRPGHSLYGEIVRQRIPAARSRLLRRNVVGLMDAAPASVETLLLYVSWALECGAAVEDRQLLRAAIFANKLYQTNFALRVARAITEPSYLPAARTEIARAYYIQGEFVLARELLGDVLDSTTELKTACAAVLLSAQLRTHIGDGPRELRLDASAWRRAIQRIAARHNGGYLDRPVDLALTGSRLLEIYASNLDGDYQETESELSQIADEDDGSDEIRLVALSLLGESLTARGKPGPGVEALRRSMELVAGDNERLLTYYEFVVTRLAMSLISSGRWDEVHDLMTAYLERSPQTLAYTGGTVNVVTGLVLVRQGLLHSALSQLSPAIGAFRENDPEQLLPLALGLGAYAAALTGQHSLAKDYADEWLCLSFRGSKQLYLLGQAHAAAAQLAIDGGSANRDKLRLVADEAAERGIVSVQLVALELSVRMGDATALRPLCDVATVNQSVPGGILSHLAWGVLAKDPERLHSASDDAAAARYFLIAADCLSFAVSLLEAKGSGQRARQFRGVLSERVSRLEGITLYPPDGCDNVADLTQRERVIATLVLEGHSNKDAAEILSISVRTVEGHLYRIFAKLGIAHREELTAQHLGLRGK